MLSKKGNKKLVQQRTLGTWRHDMIVGTCITFSNFKETNLFPQRSVGLIEATEGKLTNK